MPRASETAQGRWQGGIHGVFVAAACVVLAILLPLSSWFRAEDLVDFDHYGHSAWTHCFTRPHLDTLLVSFYRPLSDLLTWALCRALGPDALLQHAALLALHGGVALAAARALRGLGLGRIASLGAVALICAHPFVPLVTLYLDGGVAQLLFAGCVMMSVAEWARWRQGQGRGLCLVLWTLAAGLCFDGGLGLPVALFLASVVAPRARRRAPWAVLAVLPVVLALRRAVLGTALGGYALAPSRDNLSALGRGLPRVAWETLVPVFGDRPLPGVEPPQPDLHPAWLEAAGGTLAAALLVLWLGVWVLRRRRGGPVASAGAGLRWGLAFALLFGAVFVPGALESALNMGRGGPFSPSFGYRLYPAAVVLALGVAAALGAARAGGGRWGAAALAALSLLGLWLGAPLRAGAGEAGELARTVRDAVVRAQEPDDERALVVLATPLSHVQGTRDLGRVLHWGLASACRPPLLDREIAVLPVFAGRHGGDLVLAPATLERLIQSPALRVMQFDRERRALFEWPTEEGADPGFELLPPSGLRRRPTPDSAEAEIVEVGPDGRFELRVRGETPGVPRLVLINPVHPFYAWEQPPSLRCERIPDPERDSDRLRVEARQFAEVARREPEQRCFAVLELLPRREFSLEAYSGAVASRVLAIRLRPARD